MRVPNPLITKFTSVGPVDLTSSLFHAHSEITIPRLANPCWTFWPVKHHTGFAQPDHGKESWNGNGPLSPGPLSWDRPLTSTQGGIPGVFLAPSLAFSLYLYYSLSYGIIMRSSYGSQRLRTFNC